MKPRLTLFLATILMFSFGHSKAQDYLPTVKEGNTWVVRWDIGMMGFSWADTVTYTLQGDTVINGYSYLKVIRLPSYYAGAAREDTLNKKIFTITRGQTVESLRFNFNLQAGDYVWVNELPTVSTTVTAIDTVFLYGRNRRRIILSSCNTNLTCHLIEGIGSSTWGLYPAYSVPGLPGALLSFSENTTTATAEEQLSADITAFPNPGSGRVHFKTKNGQESTGYYYQVYNIQGRLLKEGVFGFTNGMAIIDIAHDSGLYFVHLTNKSTGQKVSHKIIVAN